MKIFAASVSSSQMDLIFTPLKMLEISEQNENEFVEVNKVENCHSLYILYVYKFMFNLI